MVASLRTKNKIAVSSTRAPATYTAEANAIGNLTPWDPAITPITSGAEPPPPSQPTRFIQPAALPLASGCTTSNSEAKILPSYIPLKKPQKVRATISHPTEVVSPHNTTKGAPQINPSA